jgi:hypothetical protein
LGCRLRRGLWGCQLQPPSRVLTFHPKTYAWKPRTSMCRLAL